MESHLTVGDVCRLTGFRAPVIRAAIRSGDLVASRPVKGGRFLIARADYLDWLDRGKVKRSSAGRGDLPPAAVVELAARTGRSSGSVRDQLRRRRTAA